MVSVTILICTRNGSQTIEASLAAACDQEGTSSDSYDILVVDNGSSDGTPELISELLSARQLSWRMISEKKEGKLNAFLKGVSEAQGEIVAVVDDDNIIARDYVSRILKFFSEYPEVGMVGSANRLYGAMEPEWFAQIRDRFACSDPIAIGEVIARPDRDRVVTTFAVPPGAGSAFRRTPLIAALQQGFFFLNDTFRGSTMSVTGEDTELCYLFQHLGWLFGIDRDLVVEHCVRPDRLTYNYALKLCRSTGAGGAAIDLFLAQSEGSLGGLRGSWWWLAGRRLKRILALMGPCLSAHIGNRHYDPVWFALHTEFGAFRRLLAERDTLAAKARYRSSQPWAHVGS